MADYQKKITVLVLPGGTFCFESDAPDIEILPVSDWNSVSESLKQAQGKYLILADEACRFTEENADGIYACAEEKETDVLLFHARRSLPYGTAKVNGYQEKRIPKNKPVFSAKECSEHIAQIAAGPLCTRLYRMDFVKKNQFAKCLNAEVFGMLSLCAAKRISVCENCFIDTGNSAKENNPDKDEYYLNLYQELAERNLWKDYQKSFLENLAVYCVQLISRTKTQAELTETMDHIENGLLSRIGYDNEPDHLAALACIADTHKKYLIRVSQKKKPEMPACNEEIAVSVIIPVYNLENYIGSCLESVMNQTLAQIEIICVSDGSFDRSYEILQEYAKKDSRIQVYAQANEGQSSARNHALRHASGKYIYCMDGDDLLIEDALAKTYAKAEAEGLDLVYFDGVSFGEENADAAAVERFSEYYRRVNSYEGVYKGCDLFAAMYANGEYRVSPCLQLIRRDVLENNDIVFTEGIIHEDNIFAFRVIMNAERAGYLHETLFRRRVRESSVMTASKTYKNVIGYFICYLEMQDFLDHLEVEENVRNEAQMCIYRILHNARNDCRAVPDPDRYAYEGLPVSEQIRYRLHVQEIVHELDSASALRKKQKEMQEQIDLLTSNTVAGQIRGLLKSDTARNLKNRIKGR